MKQTILTAFVCIFLGLGLAVVYDHFNQPPAIRAIRHASRFQYLFDPRTQLCFFGDPRGKAITVVPCNEAVAKEIKGGTDQTSSDTSGQTKAEDRGASKPEAEQAGE